MVMIQVLVSRVSANGADKRNRALEQHWQTCFLILVKSLINYIAVGSLLYFAENQFINIKTAICNA